MTAVSKVRVLIAEDHAVVREGTRRILEEHPDLVVVAEAGDGIEAVQQAKRTLPHVALVDIRLPRINGIEAARRLRAESPGTRVLVLSAYDDDDTSWRSCRPVPRVTCSRTCRRTRWSKP